MMIHERESGADVFDSMQVEVDMEELSMADVEYEDNLDHLDDLDEAEEDELDEEEEEEEEDEDYAFPIGPLPQNITNDLKSLDEMVSHFSNIHFTGGGGRRKSPYLWGALKTSQNLLQFPVLSKYML